MSSMLETVEKEIIRLEIMELCQMAAPDGTNVKIIRGCLKKNEEELPEEEEYQGEEEYDEFFDELEE